MEVKEVSTAEHYDLLVDEDNDPVHDIDILKAYMTRWDGPLFYETLGQLDNKRVLEVGVGTGRIAKTVLDRGCGTFTGIDVSYKSIQRASDNLRDYKNIELIEADIAQFVRKDYYDVVYSVLTFMHIEDKRSAIGNIVTSLKVGGIVVLSLSESREWLDFGSRKVRLYPDTVEENVGYFMEMGCIVDRTIDLVDTFIAPDGSKSETYGSKIATLIKAAKV